MLAATGGGTPGGQDGLEMPPRQAVLPLEKERPRQFQAHPHQPRRVDQHDAEGGDGLVEQDVAVGGGAAGPLGGFQRRQAVEEEHVGVDRRLREQPPQGDDGRLEAAGVDEGLGGVRGGGWRGSGRGVGAPGRGGRRESQQDAEGGQGKTPAGGAARRHRGVSFRCWRREAHAVQHERPGQ